MSREAHVRFWERAVVKFRRATRLLIVGEAFKARREAGHPLDNESTSNRIRHTIGDGLA